MTILSDSSRQKEGETRLKNIVPPERGSKWIFDGHKEAPKGFGVRVLSTGVISFVLRYSANGKDRRVTIGQYPKPWSLAAARIRAGELRRKIDGGADIAADRRTDREAPTVAAKVETFCQEHFDKQKSGKASRSRLMRYFVKALGKEKLKDVRRADIKRVVQAVAEEHGREAALLLTNIKSFYAWCEDEELVESNPVASLRPQKVHGNLKPRVRTRILDEDEIRAFWAKVETVGMHRLTAIALKLILATGQRPGEVAGIRWSEIQNQVWTIPASRRGKTDTEHQVPLTKTALDLLETAKSEVDRLSVRRETTPGDIIFETRPRQALRADAISRAVARYNEILGSKRHPDFGLWTAHDLRRTMRTGLAAAGASVMVAEMAIGHVKRGIIGVYDAHHYHSEIRLAMEAWELRLLHLTDGTRSESNVVALRRGHAS